MIKRPRVIPTLLIDSSNLVKTTKFKNPDYLGDPINSIKIFNEKGVDELCVLDIRASKNEAEPDYELLREMALQAFMPLSYGGGITSVDQMRRIFRLGFEKVVINTAWIENPQLIRLASKTFGSQSIVVSIDYKKGFGGTYCYSKDGTRKEKISPLQLAKNAEDNGAGEILLYSMDRDGTRKGYDLKMVKNVSENIHIPLIACGGASGLGDLKKALDAGADAVAAGSIFVYFGDIKGVLINFPGYRDFVDSNIFGKEMTKYEL